MKRMKEKNIAGRVKKKERKKLRGKLLDGGKKKKGKKVFPLRADGLVSVGKK